MDQVDRYVLGLAVLEGDRDARKILADLLEEQGERGLADWARKCKPRLHQRLDFSIMLLPYRWALHLGCDFAGAAKFVEAIQLRDISRNYAGAIRQWLAGEIPPAQMDVFCEAFQVGNRSDLGVGVPSSDRDVSQARSIFLICEQLASATQMARKAESAEAETDYRRMRHWENASKGHVRQVAALSRFWMSPAAALTEHPLAGIEWQQSRARIAFQALIVGSDTFPIIR